MKQWGGYLLVVYFIILMVVSYQTDKVLEREKKKTFYVPPSKYMKYAAGNFQSFFADLYYIAGILALTDPLDGQISRIEWVQKNMDLATDLDPEMVDAYFFAGVVVTRRSGHRVNLRENIQKGIDFLKKGVKHNPDNWRVLYWLGFSYFHLGKYEQAAQCYQQAAELPGAPRFLKTNPIWFYYKKGDIEAAKQYIRGLLATVENSPRQQKAIESKLQWLRNISELEKKVQEFRIRYQRLPKNLKELIEVGLLEKIPEDPFGKGYFLDNQGRVRSTFRPQNKNSKSEK